MTVKKIKSKNKLESFLENKKKGKRYMKKREEKYTLREKKLVIIEKQKSIQKHLIYKQFFNK